MAFEALAAHLGIDLEEFMELVELYVKTCRSDLEKIRQGIRRGIPADAAAGAHSIKGASGNLGFKDMEDRARKMETQAKAGSLENFEVYIQDLENRLVELGRTGK